MSEVCCLKGDAYNWGKILGMQMNDKGIDWILQPSIDMCLDPLMYLMAISDDPKIIGKIYKIINEIAEKQGFKENGYRVIVNCGKDGGQEVGHLHFHLLACFCSKV